MWRHVHPGPAAHILRAVVVGEAPRPDQRSLTLWQCAPDHDGAWTAQRHLTRMQHAGEWQSRAGEFGRGRVGVAHELTLAPLGCAAPLRTMLWAHACEYFIGGQHGMGEKAVVDHRAWWPSPHCG